MFDTGKVGTICISVYLFLLATTYIYDFDACAETTSTSLKPRQADVLTAIERGKLAASFDVSAMLETFILLYLLFVKQSRIMSTALLVLTLAVRARHVGIGACTPNDTTCCSALNCFEFPACTTPPFLSTQTDWNLRLNYCPMPYFYYKDAKARLSCTTLANTPDMASCYRYGCSSTHTPRTYYSNRVGVGVLLIISALKM